MYAKKEKKLPNLADLSQISKQQETAHGMIQLPGGLFPTAGVFKEASLGVLQAFQKQRSIFSINKKNVKYPSARTFLFTTGRSVNCLNLYVRQYGNIYRHSKRMCLVPPKVKHRTTTWPNN